jgi:hypothetical protein
MQERLVLENQVTLAIVSCADYMSSATEVMLHYLIKERLLCYEIVHVNLWKILASISLTSLSRVREEDM